jgi:mycothiol system anti-sigma-R factor
MISGCEHALEYVYSYLDEEISFFHQSRVSVHLKSCASCTSAYEFERRLKTLIRERGRTEPPPELFDALRALIQEEREGDGPRYEA